MKDIPIRQIITASLSAAALLYFVQTPESAADVFLRKGLFSGVILVASVLLIVRAYRGWKRKVTSLRIQLMLTPVVVAIISLYGLLMVNNIDANAKKILWTAAEGIQATCQTSGNVPTFIDGWEKNGAWFRRTVQVGKTTYTFFYNPLPEKKEYIVGINYGPDARFELSGGVNKPVERYRKRP